MLVVRLKDSSFPLSNGASNTFYFLLLLFPFVVVGILTFFNQRVSSTFLPK